MSNITVLTCEGNLQTLFLVELDYTVAVAMITGGVHYTRRRTEVFAARLPRPGDPVNVAGVAFQVSDVECREDRPPLVRLRAR